MTIFIVEDDDDKLEYIKNMLLQALDKSEISTAGSVAEAKKELRSRVFDLLILDMSLPSYTVTGIETGGEAQHFGGGEVLDYIRFRELKIPTIVITQYPRLGQGVNEMNIATLESQLRDQHAEFFLGIIHYSSISEKWKSDMKRMLSNNGWELKL
jgi:CheY-like chemotaxis protein